MYDDLYEWLYETYALPKIQDICDGQDDALVKFAQRVSLTQKQRLRLTDMAANMRVQCGTEAFALGVRFGMELAAPRSPDTDCSWLLHFLPQLDDPVA